MDYEILTHHTFYKKMNYEADELHIFATVVTGNGAIVPVSPGNWFDGTWHENLEAALNEAFEIDSEIQDR